MTGPAEHKFVGPDGTELHYLTLGAGRSILLFHGFAADERQWLDHGPARTLATDHQVILPRLRGHGRLADKDRLADQPRWPADVLTEDALALVHHLGLSEFDVCGYSLGARIALRMLARGARPRRAVLAGQGLHSILSAATGGRHHRVLTALAENRSIAPTGTDASTAHWLRLLGGQPQSLLRALDTVVPTSPDTLHTVSTPTLVMIGDADPEHRFGARLAHELPHARFITVRGDHWSALGGADFAAAMSEFLTG